MLLLVVPKTIVSFRSLSMSSRVYQRRKFIDIVKRYEFSQWVFRDFYYSMFPGDLNKFVVHKNPAQRFQNLFCPGNKHNCTTLCSSLCFYDLNYALSYPSQNYFYILFNIFFHPKEKAANSFMKLFAESSRKYQQQKQKQHNIVKFLFDIRNIIFYGFFFFFIAKQQQLWSQQILFLWLWCEYKFLHIQTTFTKYMTTKN